MITKTILIIIVFLTGTIKQIYAQENTFLDSLGCLAYYDTILQKKVYKTASVYPMYDSTDMNKFERLLMYSVVKEKIELTAEEFLCNNKVLLYFVINEEGEIENIHIGKKKREEYTTMDKTVLKVLDRLNDRKWEPGNCKGKKVPVLLSFPLRFDFRDSSFVTGDL